MDQSLLWLIFGIFVIGALTIDLGVFNKKLHTPSLKESVTWCLIWFTLAMIFNFALYFLYGTQQATAFLSGYLIELSLSVDNLFVFIMIFSFFKVPPKYQHKILFWGILGAVIFRAIFIAAGLSLIHRFEWLLYLLGVFLVLVGLKMIFKGDDDEANFEKSLTLKFIRKYIPFTDEYDNSYFITLKNGRRYGTPMLMVLLCVEVTDVIFALDSIPAVIAVTRNPFVVFTSNIFAILGLRSLYFLLSGIMKYFCYLHYGVSLILIFIGTKMLLQDIYKIPAYLTLTVMANILFVSIVLSVIRGKGKDKTNP